MKLIIRLQTVEVRERGLALEDIVAVLQHNRLQCCGFMLGKLEKDDSE